MKFLIPSMSCGGCARGVTQAIHKVDAQAQVQVDLSSKWVSIDSQADATQLLAALADADFAVAQQTP